MAGKSFIFRFADIEVREREFSLTKAGERLAVEPKAFRVLLILVRNPGKLIPKQELLDAVWGDAAVTENSLARAVALLRKLLGEDTRNPRYIETVATVGYRFVGRVETVEDSSAPSSASPVETAASPTNASAPPPPALPPPKRRSLGKFVLGAAAASLLLLAAAFWYLSRPLPSPRITTYTQITHDGRGKNLGGTDGSRLYFTQASPLAIEQVSVNGGDATPVPLAIADAEMQLGDVSPDGSSALVWTNERGHVASSWWIASLLGGTARRLGDGENGAFSPDGLSVIYVTIEGDIILAQIDGHESRKLAHVTPGAYCFSWSPDRKSIRFIADSMLWEMAADGSGLHRLLSDWREGGNQFWGRWTPDGHFYLFTGGTTSLGNQIWALDERRRLFGKPSLQPVRLTTGPVVWGRLIPGRDGTKIFAEGQTQLGELSRIDPRTGALQPFLGGISAEYVSFSPDGKSVAYVSFPDGALWKADRDGGDRVQLVDGTDSIYNPQWSPNSKQIVYPATPPDGHVGMYLISADGGKPQRLLPAETANMGDPNWSPDGKRVLFGQGFFPTASGERNPGDLRILDLGTGQVSVVPGSSNMWSPRWSSDGRYIVAKWRELRSSLPILDFKTQKWSALPITGDAEFPSFSHDSRFVYFLRFGRDQGAFRVPVMGGREERVADLTNWHITGFFGFSMTLDPTDAPLVLRDTGTSDIYALTLEEK